MAVNLHTSTLRTQRILSIYDGSIVRNESDLEAYEKTREVKHIKTTSTDEADTKPTWFTIRPLSWDELVRINAKVDVTSGDTVNYLRFIDEVFRLGVVRISGLQVIDPDTDELIPYRVKWEDQLGSFKRMTTESCLIFPELIRRDIGGFIFEISQMAAGGEHEKNS